MEDHAQAKEEVVTSQQCEGMKLSHNFVFCLVVIKHLPLLFLFCLEVILNTRVKCFQGEVVHRKVKSLQGYVLFQKLCIRGPKVF